MERQIKLYPLTFEMTNWSKVPGRHVKHWLPDEHLEFLPSEKDVPNMAPFITVVGRNIEVCGCKSVLAANGIYTWFPHIKVSGCSTWWSADFCYVLCFNKKTYALYAAKDIQKKDGRDLVGSEILRWDSETKVYAELPNRPGFTGCTISGAINETMNGSYLFDPEGETHLDRKNSEKWGHHYPAVWWKPDRSYFMYVLFNKSTCMYEHRVNHGKFSMTRYLSSYTIKKPWEPPHFCFVEIVTILTATMECGKNTSMIG